jgi:hypothetical protein
MPASAFDINTRLSYLVETTRREGRTTSLPTR